jgi:hypothetical protein
MKKVLKISVLVAFVLFSFTSQAQVQFGVKGGLNASTLSGYDRFTELVGAIGLGDLKTQSKAGYHIGVIAQINLPATSFFIQPELLYTNLGVKESIKNSILMEDASETSSLNYLQVPVYAGYKWNAGLGLDIIAGVGPYIGYGLSATDDMFDGDTDGHFNRFDYGLSAMAGVQFYKVQITLGYDLGLGKLNSGNIWKDANDLLDLPAISNRNIKVSLAYLF